MNTNKTQFQSKYHIESARLKNWDYSAEAAYFVTICTKDKKHFFGKISAGKMILSAIGEIAAKEWQNTKTIRPNIKVDVWIVMPNHLHGIIIVEPHCSAALQQWKNKDPQESQRNQFGPQSNNLASIIRGFKSATTKNIHIAGFNEFAWQARYYDHVIRDENELTRLREYIINNPKKWDLDKNNSENICKEVETHSSASLLGKARN